MNTGEKVLAHLATYALKQERNGEWRCNSPLRPGANSHSFTLKIEADGEHGVWDDHAGGEGGSLYQLAERLGIELPTQERPEVQSSKRAYKNLAEYAAFKGVPEQAFIDAKWTRDPVTYDKRPALQFPTKGGTRYRFIDGNKPAFKSQKDYKACWYGLDTAIKTAKLLNQPLIICNGEPSVVVGVYYKLPACAITGGEQPTIPVLLLEELKTKWQGVILLAMDCDEAGRKSANGKSNILTAAGFMVKIIDLGLGYNGDLADYCKLNGESSLTNLIALSEKVQAPAQDTTPELAGMLKQLVAARKSSEPDIKKSLPALLDQIQSEIDHSRLKEQSAAVQSFASLVSTRHKRLDEARKNPSKIQGLRSGIQKLDDLTGGFVPGRIHTFYGDTGMGKSTLVASIVTALAGQAPGFIIPTESMPGDYLDKIAAFKAGVPFDVIETGEVNADQYRTIMSVYNWLENRNCHIMDNLSPTSTLLGSAIREGMKMHGYQWVAIDSLNNLDSLVHDDLYGKTTEAADFAQELARLGLVVLNTVQVGRNLKTRKNKMPQLNDGLGSGKIEQNSDVVISLYNHQYYVEKDLAKLNDKFPPGKVLIRCLKHRFRSSNTNVGHLLTFKGGVGFYD